MMGWTDGLLILKLELSIQKPPPRTKDRRLTAHPNEIPSFPNLLGRTSWWRTSL